MGSSKSSDIMSATQASIVFAGAVAVSYVLNAWQRSLQDRKQKCNVDQRKEEDLDEDAASVLSYWFDGSLGDNYKLKWFPSSSSSIQTKADDAVRSKFSVIFNVAITNGLKHWGSSTQALIAEIIVLDQFSRCVDSYFLISYSNQILIK